MKNYLFWIDAASGVFALLGFFYLLLSKRLGNDTPTPVKLLGRLSWAAVFICLGAVGWIPILFSPRPTVTGQVQGFHRVHANRGSYYFEFQVAGQDSTPTVHADYSDKGFYSGDPIIANGDTLAVTYLQVNGEAIKLRELVGAHSGWEYEADTKPLAPPIFIVVGFAFIVGAVAGCITDAQARPEEEPGNMKPLSTLGL
jgi:hypothetical protein